MSKEKQLEVIRNAVNKGWISFSYAIESCEELANDRDLIIVAVKDNPNVLRKLPEKLRGDKEIVLEAVRISRDIFDYASDEMKNDKDVCLAVLEHEMDRWEKHPYTKFGPDAKKDRDVLKKFLSKEIRFDFEELDEEILKDEELMEIAIKNNSAEIFGHIHEDLKNKELFIKRCLKVTTYLFKKVHKKFHTKDMVMYVLENCGKKDPGDTWGYFYWSLDENLRDDREMFKAFLEKGAKYRKEVNEKFKNDKELLLLGLKNSYDYLKHMDAKDIDKDLVIAACENSPYVLEDDDINIPHHIRYDPEFYVEALKKQLRVLDYVRVCILRDEETVRKFVKEVPGVLDYVMKNWYDEKAGYDIFEKIYEEQQNKKATKEEEEEEEEGEGETTEVQVSEEEILFDKVLENLKKLENLGTEKFQKLLEAVMATKYELVEKE